MPPNQAARQVVRYQVVQEVQMPVTADGVQTKVIVIPRQLEQFFYQRLCARYAERGDVRVVVDRRLGERRARRWTAGPEPLTDRRHTERRDSVAAWTLPDMPFAVS
jgi:hypothetical protein